MKGLVWDGGKDSRRENLTRSSRQGPEGREPPGSGGTKVSKINKCLLLWTLKSTGNKAVASRS